MSFSLRLLSKLRLTKVPPADCQYNPQSAVAALHVKHPSSHRYSLMDGLWQHTDRNLEMLQAPSSSQHKSFEMNSIVRDAFE